MATYQTVGRSLTSLQQRLVKTGGRLMKHARYYWLMLAESHLTQWLFGAKDRRHAGGDGVDGGGECSEKSDNLTVKAGEVPVKCTEKAGLRGFGFSGNSKTAPCGGEGGSRREGDWAYTDYKSGMPKRKFRLTTGIENRCARCAPHSGRPKLVVSGRSRAAGDKDRNSNWSTQRQEAVKKTWGHVCAPLEVTHTTRPPRSVPGSFHSFQSCVSLNHWGPKTEIQDKLTAP